MIRTAQDFAAIVKQLGGVAQSTSAEGSRETTPSTHWSRTLHRPGLCRDLAEYGAHFDTFAAMWAACPRGDWLIHWVARAFAYDPGRWRDVVALACAVGRLALPFASASDKQFLATIQIAERWAHGWGYDSLADLIAAADAAGAADLIARGKTPQSIALSAAGTVAYLAASYRAAGVYGEVNPPKKVECLAIATATAWTVAALVSSAAFAHHIRRGEGVDAAAARRVEMLGACANVVRASYPDPPEFVGTT